jgi:hypothetical protein
MPGTATGKAQAECLGFPNVPNMPYVKNAAFAVNFTSVNKTIVGITKDSVGVAVGACTVNLYLTETNQWVNTTVSDGSGNYSFIATPGRQYYVVSYKAGSPDIAGTTVNTLVGA